MKKYIITPLFYLAVAASAQLIDFENYVLDTSLVYQGKDGKTSIVFEEANFPVKYNTQFSYWESGWAISGKNDSTTEASDYATQLFCAKTGKGKNNSLQYAIGQNGSYIINSGNYADFRNISFSITNTTYAYNSMYFGDFVGKKFGGNSGTDPDYFFLKINAFRNGNWVDSDTIILADFRFANSSEDYILSSWQETKLFERVDSVRFEMESSDTGQFGMNTPAFFALDDAHYQYLASDKELFSNTFSIYPNPGNGKMNITHKKEIEKVQVLDFSGREIMVKNVLDRNSTTIDLSGYPSGYYLIQIFDSETHYSEPYILVK